MAVSEVNYFESGGGISPATTPAYNESTTDYNAYAESVPVTSGKTYAVAYHVNNKLDSTVNSPNEILKDIATSAGTSWGNTSYYVYTHLLIVKAKTSTLTITNSANRVFGLIVEQLD